MDENTLRISDKMTQKTQEDSMKVTDTYSLIKKDLYNFEVQEKIQIDKNHRFAKEGGDAFRLEKHYFATPELALRFILRHSLDFEDATTFQLSIDTAMNEISAHCEQFTDDLK